MALLLTKPSFWLLSFGAAAASICGYGLGFWLPSYFTTSLGLPLDQLGYYFGTIVLVGGSLGIWFGGWLGDKLGGARPGAYALVPGIAFLLTAPLYVVAINNEFARRSGWCSTPSPTCSRWRGSARSSTPSSTSSRRRCARPRRPACC